MAKLTLENLINILKRKNVITKKDIEKEQRRTKGYENSLLFKNLLSKEEFEEVKSFLETKVLEHYKPTNSISSMHYRLIVEPLVREFGTRGGVKDIAELYRYCYTLRKELTPALKLVMNKLEEYTPEKTLNACKAIL